MAREGLERGERGARGAGGDCRGERVDMNCQMIKSRFVVSYKAIVPPYLTVRS